MWGQLKTHRINCFLIVVVDNLRSRIIPDNMEVTREHFERDSYQLLRDITQGVKTAQFGKLLVLSLVPVCRYRYLFCSSFSPPALPSPG